MPLDHTIFFRAAPPTVYDPAESAMKAARLKDLMLSIQEREAGLARTRDRQQFEREFWAPQPAAQPQQPATRLADLADAGQQAKPAPARQPDPIYSRLGDYAAGLAQRGFVDDALQVRGMHEKWQRGEDVRDAWQQFSDPLNKDRHSFLAEVGRRNPERAMEWAKDLADFDEQIAQADREGLARGRDVLRQLGQVISSATDQASYDRARAWADEMGLDSNNLPAEYDPETIEQLRRYNLTAAQQLDQVWKARRFDQSQDNIDADNARSDEQLGLSYTRERRIASGRTPAQRAPSQSAVLGRILDKVARGEKLTPGEQRAYDMSRTRSRRGGRGAPASSDATLDANGNVPNPGGLNTVPNPVAARSRPAPGPRQGGQTSGGRYKLPQGYTPQRFVAEARAAVKAGAPRAAVEQRLRDAGFPASALGR